MDRLSHPFKEATDYLKDSDDLTYKQTDRARRFFISRIRRRRGYKASA